MFRIVNLGLRRGAESGIANSLGLATEELIRAIGKGDLAQLTRVPGVGRKIAERMVVELRDKVALLEPLAQGTRPAKSDAEEDLLSALLNLGYERRAAEQALEGAQSVGGDFDAMLRAALKQLGGVSASAEGHGGRR